MNQFTDGSNYYTIVDTPEQANGLQESKKSYKNHKTIDAETWAGTVPKWEKLKA